MRISSFPLSVITNPPNWHPHASSNDPVTVTPASLAHLTPRRIISIVPSFPPNLFPYSFAIHSVTDDIMELHAELELLSPRDTGICESTVSDHPSGSSMPKCRNVFFTQIRAIFVSSPGSFIILTERSSPDTMNSDDVTRSTPTVAPMPHGIAFTTVIAPWDIIRHPSSLCMRPS
jgi:hypothetical protein